MLHCSIVVAYSHSYSHGWFSVNHHGGLLLHAKLAVHFLCQGVDFPCQDGFINYGSCHGNEYIAIKEEDNKLALYIAVLVWYLHDGCYQLGVSCWLQDTP